MSEQRPALRIEDKVRAENRLYTLLFHTGEKRIWWGAMFVALLLHAGVALMPMPRARGAAVPPEIPDASRAIAIRAYRPPPPPAASRSIRGGGPGAAQPATRRIPIPDPTPDAPEPVREPILGGIGPEALPPDAEVFLGSPEGPPSSGPLIAGAAGVSFPELIPESKIDPEYPETARRAQLEGSVILQAVIVRDGTVEEIRVLRCSTPGVGFEQAAVDAVRIWRYRPAEQNGRRVDVYFTVKVDFVLQ